MTELELLFEFRGSRRRIIGNHSNICQLIELELKRFGQTTARVQYSGDCGGCNSFLLQKWSTAWNSFIDVESAHELEDRDRITVVLCSPSAESSQSKARIT